jgi:hypothetical protein
MPKKDLTFTVRERFDAGKPQACVYAPAQRRIVCKGPAHLCGAVFDGGQGRLERA